MLASRKMVTDTAGKLQPSSKLTKNVVTNLGQWFPWNWISILRRRRGACYLLPSCASLETLASRLPDLVQERIEIWDIKLEAEQFLITKNTLLFVSRLLEDNIKMLSVLRSWNDISSMVRRGRLDIIKVDLIVSAETAFNCWNIIRAFVVLAVGF